MKAPGITRTPVFLPTAPLAKRGGRPGTSSQKIETAPGDCESRGDCRGKPPARDGEALAVTSSDVLDMRLIGPGGGGGFEDRPRAPAGAEVLRKRVSGAMRPGGPTHESLT